MRPDQPTQELLQKLLVHYEIRCEERREERRSKFRRIFRWRESVATLMLGCPSLALTGILFVVTVIGLAGFPLRPWNVPRTWMAEAKPLRFEYHIDVDGIEYSYRVLVPYATVYMPSDECSSLGVVGAVLACLGLVESYRKRRFSWLSGISITLFLITNLIIIVCSWYMNL